MDKLQKNFDLVLRNVPTDFYRYMFGRINWENRLLGLVGPRGVGKTTLVLQYALKQLKRNETLYVTADDLYFANHKLLDLADEFSRLGGKVLVIDEIHKYKEWSRELKLIYDYHADLKVIFTGSSILDITKGTSDLSRRAVMYQMQGLSFREYLQMFHQISLPVYSLEEIVLHQVEIPGGFRPYAYFQSYLKNGYYPFAKEEDFELRLQQVVRNTLETDILQFAEINVATARKLKQLLAIISQSVPFKPNMSSLATMINAGRNNLADYFLYMEEAGLIAQLRDDTGGIRGLGKVDKVYLDNTNLVYVLGEKEANIGNVRETFFFNQLRVNQDVMTSSVSDFQIGNRTFEVGGKNKKQKQLQGVDHGFVVKDDIETGYLNVIPLWMFGLNY